MELLSGYDLDGPHQSIIRSLAPNDTKGPGAEPVLGLPYGLHLYAALLRFEVGLNGDVSNCFAVEGGIQLVAAELRTNGGGHQASGVVVVYWVGCRGRESPAFAWHGRLVATTT